MHMLGSEVRPGEAARYLSARSSNHQVKKTHQSKAGRSICLVQLQGQADSHRPKRGPDLAPLSDLTETKPCGSDLPGAVDLLNFSGESRRKDT